MIPFAAGGSISRHRVDLFGVNVFETPFFSRLRFSIRSKDLLQICLIGCRQSDEFSGSCQQFLTRRFMQAATAAAPPGAGALPPQEGDGFTFEHLAGRDSIWLDFVADIGDGGDSTYAVACCMAAPSLLASEPSEPTAGPSNGASCTSRDMPTFDAEAILFLANYMFAGNSAGFYICLNRASFVSRMCTNL